MTTAVPADVRVCVCVCVCVCVYTVKLKDLVYHTRRASFINHQQPKYRHHYHHHCHHQIRFVKRLSNVVAQAYRRAKKRNDKATTTMTPTTKRTTARQREVKKTHTALWMHYDWIDGVRFSSKSRFGRRAVCSAHHVLVVNATRRSTSHAALSTHLPCTRRCIAENKKYSRAGDLNKPMEPAKPVKSASQPVIEIEKSQNTIAITYLSVPIVHQKHTWRFYFFFFLPY